MWVFMFEIEEKVNQPFDFDFYCVGDKVASNDFADCFAEDEKYVYDHKAGCYCWYDAEHDAWYWLNEETKEWLLVKA
jgi:hypothetical protein